MSEKLSGFRMPGEWELQKSVWIAWPYNKNDWPGLYKLIPEVILEIISKMIINQDQDIFPDFMEASWTLKKTWTD